MSLNSGSLECSGHGDLQSDGTCSCDGYWFTHDCSVHLNEILGTTVMISRYQASDYPLVLDCSPFWTCSICVYNFERLESYEK